MTTVWYFHIFFWLVSATCFGAFNLSDHFLQRRSKENFEKARKSYLAHSVTMSLCRLRETTNNEESNKKTKKYKNELCKNVIDQLVQMYFNQYTLPLHIETAWLTVTHIIPKRKKWLSWDLVKRTVLIIIQMYLYVHGSQLRIFKKEELSARTRQKTIFARHSLTHRLLGLYRNASPTLLGKRNHSYF